MRHSPFHIETGAAQISLLLLLASVMVCRDDEFLPKTSTQSPRNPAPYLAG